MSEHQHRYGSIEIREIDKVNQDGTITWTVYNEEVCDCGATGAKRQVGRVTE